MASYLYTCTQCIHDGVGITTQSRIRFSESDIALTVVMHPPSGIHWVQVYKYDVIIVTHT